MRILRRAIMSLPILKNIITTVVIVAEIRKLCEGAESELTLLRQENTRLTRVLSDLQQNYSIFLTQQNPDWQADDASEDVEGEAIKHDNQILVNDCFRGAMHLLEESIHVYDDFIKGELLKAKDELCEPECTSGERDWTYEYKSAKCEVADHVEKKIFRPFAKRADTLRDSANRLMYVLDKMLRIQFEVTVDSGDSSSSSE